MEFDVCLEMVFTDLPYAERIAVNAWRAWSTSRPCPITRSRCAQPGGTLTKHSSSEEEIHP